MNFGDPLGLVCIECRNNFQRRRPRLEDVSPEARSGSIILSTMGQRFMRLPSDLGQAVLDFPETSNRLALGLSGTARFGMDCLSNPGLCRGELEDIGRGIDTFFTEANRGLANATADDFSRSTGNALFDATLLFAPLAGRVPALARTGIRSEATRNSTQRQLVRAADEVFEQAAFSEVVGLGPEVVNGFRIFGNKGLVGTSFQRNIFYLQAEQVGARSPRALLRAFEVEARAAGASELRIVGHAVINERLINPGLAQRLGFIFRQINDDSIELVKRLSQ